MKAAKKSRIGQIFSDGRKIDEALRSAAREAVLRHKRENAPVVVWRDGKAVWIPARELRPATSPRRK